MVGPELIQPTVTVARELQPYPQEGSIALAPLVLVLLVVSVIYAVRRRRMRRHGSGGTLATLALGVALGNALCELDGILRGSRPAVMMGEHANPEVELPGDGRDPTARPPDDPAPHPK